MVGIYAYMPTNGVYGRHFMYYIIYISHIDITEGGEP